MAGDQSSQESGSLGLPPNLIAQAEAVACNTNQHEGQGTVHRQRNDLHGSASEDLQHNLDLSPAYSSHHDQTRQDDFDRPATPPPAYSDAYGTVSLRQDGLNTEATVANDGRVDINIDQKSATLSNIIVPILKRELVRERPEDITPLPPGYIPPSLGGIPGDVPPPPPMNVVIHVVGSRGDVQPFVALGQVLKKTYGHRVRLATHPVFRDFVEENGLEFFSISGDPAELMAFMVKNPGLMPGKDALRSGDIGKRRKGMYEIVRGCWRSCFEAGDGTGIAVSDGQPIADFDGTNRPFVADAIIANPPSFAHVHIAEKLGVPLHLMFTMPWSPTQAFPHPLANIQSSNADTSITNFVSYAIVEMMTWQGLGDIINRFRENSLGLEPIPLMQAPGLIPRLRVPYTYCWSPALIPKPKDWGRHISICGFYFLSLARNYQAADDLARFLNAGPSPVYIGFGSIVLDDPNGMTKLIFEAVKKTGQRALISKGWGGVGADELGIPDGVFMLGNVPHDWLFKHVSCVVHHGGAGTTAAGIALSKPTVVVPFFGDQPFWGAMIARAGAGPEPIPHKQLTAEKLAEAIEMALKPSTLERARELGSKIASEKGSDIGAKCFHDAINTESLRCSFTPSRTAIWELKKTEIRLSGFAAAVLGNEGLLDFGNLRLYRYKEYDTEDGPWEPITGATSALMGTISSMMMGVADMPMELFKSTSRKSDKSSVSRNDGQVQAHDAEQDTTLNASTSGDNVPEASKRSDSPIIGTSGTSSGLVDSPTSARRSVQEPSRAKSPARHGVTLSDAIGAGKGVARVVDAGIKSPMDFTLSLAKGFHNAPRLYGDLSVRPHERITGFQSGLKAAGKEFGFGFYDGITGLVTHPLEGAKKEGFSGLAKGFGKGIGGLVFKPGAAIWGLPGYTFKGIWKELQKHFGASVQNYIIAARIAQGYGELKESNEDERRDVIKRWHAVQPGRSLQKKWWAHKQSSSAQETGGSSEASVPRNTSEQNAHSSPSSVGAYSEDEAYERAIKASVAATSTGNELQDRWIERAIQASITELRRTTDSGQKDDALERAISASIAEANKARSEEKDFANDTEFDEQLALAIQRSLGLQETQTSSRSDDPDVDTDDDENIRQALERSRSELHKISTHDEVLDRAITTSLEESDARKKGENNAEDEERIVMEYVKKQSLLETEYKGKADT